GLRIRDVLESKRARLRHRVGKARAAEIDREHPRTLEWLRGQDRVLAGTASRDENVEAPGFAEGAERRVRKSLAQIGIDAGVFSRRPGVNPARIRVSFVLRLHGARNLAFDRREL